MGILSALQALEPIKEFEEVLTALRKETARLRMKDFLKEFAATGNLQKADKLIQSYTGSIKKLELPKVASLYGQVDSMLKALLTDETYALKIARIRAGMAKGTIGLEEAKALSLLHVRDALTEQGKKVLRLEKHYRKYQMRALSLLGAMFGISKVSSYLDKTWKSLVASGEVILDVTEELGWFFEDFSDIVSESVEPTLFGLIDILNKILTWTDELPEEVKIAIFVTVTGAKVFADLASLIADVTVAAYGMQAGLFFMASKFPWIAKMLDFLGTHFWGLAASIGAVIGGFFLGYYAARYLIDAFGPLGAVIIPIIGLAWSLTAAILALYGVISWGTAIPLLLAGVAAAIGGVVAASVAAKPEAFSFQDLPLPVTFNEITPAVIHPGETLLPAGYKKRGPSKYQKKPEYTVTVNIEGASSVEDIVERAVIATVDELESKISEGQERHYRRSEY